MKAVFLLHGWLTDINDFETIIPYLEKNYDHIERISYPGHITGSNYDDFDADSTFALVDKSFKKIINQYEIVDVIGYSMGGSLATYLSTKYEFRKLVLLAPANKYLNLKFPFSRIKHFIKSAYEVQKAYLKFNKKEQEKVKEKIRTVLHDDLESVKYVKNKILQKYYRSAFNHFKDVITRVNDELVEISNPCFIAWGELDQLVPSESASLLYNLCTNEKSQLKIYPDLSHFLIMAKGSDELVEDIEKFLAD